MMNHYEEYYEEYRRLGYSHLEAKWRATDEWRKWDKRVLSETDIDQENYELTIFKPDIEDVLTMNQLLRHALVSSNLNRRHKTYLALILYKHNLLTYLDTTNQELIKPFLPSNIKECTLEEKNMLLMSGYTIGKNSDRVKWKISKVMYQIMGESFSYRRPSL